MKRALVFAALLALAGLAWWLGQRARTTPEGLVVIVEIVDEAGVPVTAAQARPRFADTEWTPADADGRVTLIGVPLVADAEAPDEATVAEAIDVRAPWFALPPGASLALESAPPVNAALADPPQTATTAAPTPATSAAPPASSSTSAPSAGR